CFFLDNMKEEFSKNNLKVEVMTSTLGDQSALLGAAHTLKKENIRKTGQFMMPVIKPETTDKDYDLYPSFPLETGNIREGVKTLAGYIVEKKTVVIEGFAGVFWNKWEKEIREALPGGLKI